MSLANERTPILRNVILYWKCFITALEEYETYLSHFKPILNEGLAWMATYYSEMNNMKAYICYGTILSFSLILSHLILSYI